MQQIMLHEPIFETLEEMARFYFYCIRQIQPYGPYYIAGASFGSTVAFEIAKQAIHSDQEIGFLGFIDGWAFYPESLRERNRFHKLMQKQCKELSERFEINQLENSELWIDLFYHRKELLWKYNITQLDIPIYLFKARELLPNLRWIDHPTNHWSNFIQKIKVYQIPGDHETMLSDTNCTILAKKITHLLSGLENHLLEI